MFEALQCNGYPREFLLSVANKIKRKETSTTNNKTAREERNTKGLAVFPYVAATTERIKKVLVRNDIYSISCMDCEVKYMGETGRALGTRTKEHHSSVKYEKTESSALAKHVIDNDHRIAWEDVKIVFRENRWSQRKWKEAWCIESENIIVNTETMAGHYQRFLRH